MRTNRSNYHEELAALLEKSKPVKPGRTKRKKPLFGLSAEKILSLAKELKQSVERKMTPEAMGRPEFYVPAFFCKGQPHNTYDMIANTAMKEAYPEIGERPLVGSIFGRCEQRFNSPGYPPSLSKQEIEVLMARMNVFDRGLFDRSQDSELLALTHLICLGWNRIPGYFSKKHLPGELESMGFPKALLPGLAEVYQKLLKHRGWKDELEVQSGIESLLLPVGQEDDSTLLLSGIKGKLFTDGSQLYWMQKRNQKPHLPSADTLDTSDTTEYLPESIVIISGYSIHNHMAKDQSLIAYAMLDAASAVQPMFLGTSQDSRETDI